MVAENTPTLLEFGRFVHLAPHQYLLSVVLGECFATERDTRATGVPYRGESDGGGGGLLGTKSVYGNDPLKIQMDKGVHEMVGDVDGYMHVTCSHITFVGKGKDHTTIRGGFKVENQQNVKFEEMTIINPGEDGLDLRGSETNVDVLKCAVKECGCTGMAVSGGAIVTATQCEFKENVGYGVYCGGANTKARLNDCTMHHNGAAGLNAWDYAVVDLHGTKTDIHSNKDDGILADGSGKVNIHLPSQHNTSHDNVGQDRHQNSGGSIANINADGVHSHT